MSETAIVAILGIIFGVLPSTIAALAGWRTGKRNEAMAKQNEVHSKVLMAKTDEIHTLANSGLAAVTAERDELRVLVADLRVLLRSAREDGGLSRDRE